MESNLEYCAHCREIFKGNRNKWNRNKEKHPYIAPPLSICDEEKIEVLNYKL